MSRGLEDKLYWRNIDGVAHCFKKYEEETFVSLCDRYEISRVNGQRCSRPSVYERYPMCDGLEIKRRVWIHSGPQNKY